MVFTSLDEAEDEGPVVNTRDPLHIDKERFQVASKRKEIQLGTISNRSEKEQEIDRKMIMQLSLNFRNTPFRQVDEDLRSWMGMQDAPESRAMSTPGATPFTGQHSLQGGQSVSGSLNNQQSTSSPTPASSSAQATKKTLEDVLIKLITNTIKPETWDSMGGPGTIDYFPLGMALTINQTPDIQEQIQELLHALRRLQDMEVAIEIRFITISEAFFERIGLDFNINIVNNNPKFENMIVSQQFAPFGQINKLTSDAVVGLQPSGQFTNTLDI